MSVTTTATIPFTCDNRTGTTSFKIRYRLSGTSVWTQFSIAPSATTVSIAGLLVNRLYDFQAVNINGADNPASAVSQNINITAPVPEFYPTNTQMGVEFPGLSDDIENYTLTIALLATPGTIIQTQEIAASDNNEYVFTGLLAGTQYSITITPSVNQFASTFTYQATTTNITTCPAPNNVTATLI